ncbi:MAG: 1-acyl-sn-glycerol-3-phosphate acyltransferase [Sandaracinaceae bacterium]|nr:1-acyl-sn-glycerol-3-phosphate acyltransferase [Sandaracinaceae bacterium]
MNGCRLFYALRYLALLIVLAIYFALGPFGYAGFFILSLFPGRDRDRRARLLQTIMRRAFRLYHAVVRHLRLIHYDPDSLRASLPKEPSILVANHPTLTDVTALIASIPNLTTVVKAPLFRARWARPLLHDAAHFEGDDGRLSSLERMLDDAEDRLKRGYHVLIFPEGTRSPKDGLHRFGRAAFELATRTGAPITPLVIRCEPRWLIREAPLLKLPARTPKLTIQALEPVYPTGITSRKLRDMVQALIYSELFEKEPLSKSSSPAEGYARINRISPEEAHR